VRKRPVLLAAASVAVGLAVLGSVVAQTPGVGPGQSKAPAAGPLPPATVVRPYSEWTPTPPPPGYVPGQSRNSPVIPAGGYLPPPRGYLPQQPGPGDVPPASPHNPNNNRPPRLTQPVVAGPGGVAPLGSDLPPPNMEMPSFRPNSNVAAPSPPLPPSVSPESSLRPPLNPAAAATSPPMPPDSLEPKPFVPMMPPVSPSQPSPTSPVSPVPSASPVPPMPDARPSSPALPPPRPDGRPLVAPESPAPIVPPTLPPLERGSTEKVSVPRVSHEPSYGTAPAASGHKSATVVSSLPMKSMQSVSLEAVCPESVVYGSEFRYELVVRNVGSAPVTGVRIEDELPVGSRYVGSDPPAEVNADRLGWAIGTLEAGAERRIVVRVKPAEEGEIRSRATVTCAAAVDAKTVVTRPRVSVAVSGPEVCKSGEETVFQIRVSNTGSGPAQGLLLQARLSEGLVHPQGAVIEAELSHLPAGETKTIPLKVQAAKAGLHAAQITVSAAGSPDATAKVAVNIVEPLLQVTQTGPGRCLVRGEPVYEITLSNPGTAATDPITVYAKLPESFEYLQASDTASYNTASRAVVWKLPGLAPGGTKTFTLKLRATSAGDGVLLTVAQAVPESAGQGVTGAGGLTVRPATRVLEAKAETPIKAEGIAAVRFEVIDLDDPVEVGKEAIYEIRVTNQGTGDCTNVQLVAAMADGTAYAGANGPTQVKAQGQHLVFDPIPNLAVKAEAVYRVKVRGTTAGDHRFRVQLTCDQVRTPVVKEESTRFVSE